MTTAEYVELRFQKPKHYNRIIKKDDVYPKIIEWNKHFDEISFAQQCYNYFFKINKIPVCKMCGREVSFGGNLLFGYTKYCSRTCAGKSNKGKANVKIRGHRAYNKATDEEIFALKFEEIEDYKFKIKEALTLFDKANIKSQLFKHDPKLLRFIYEKSSAEKFGEKCFEIINEKKKTQCLICGKDTKFVGFSQGYNDTCSIRCSRILAEQRKGIRNREVKYCDYKKDIEASGVFEVCSEKHTYVNTGVFLIKHLQCGNEFEFDAISNRFSFYCPSCNTKSRWEEEINSFIKNLKLPTVCNTRPLKDNSLPGNKGNLEIDILIPNLNIGIECNGNFFHSENAGEKNRNYHLKKTVMSREQLDADLIHILQSEWMNKQEIVKSILANKIGKTKTKIFARKCIIGEVDSKTKKDFLNYNHLQGNCNSSLNLGLFYQDELISLMTFGKRKITGKSGFELLRFCNKLNTSVTGGASKLFKHFVNNFEFDEITTYADKRYSNGNLYKHLGFTFNHESAPNYWYVHKSDYLKLYHRANFMKHKLSEKLEKYDSSKTEWENMQNNGYDRIWDCGNYVFTYTNS